MREHGLHQRRGAHRVDCTFRVGDVTVTDDTDLVLHDRQSLLAEIDCRSRVCGASMRSYAPDMPNEFLDTIAVVPYEDIRAGHDYLVDVLGFTSGGLVELPDG